MNNRLIVYSVFIIVFSFIHTNAYALTKMFDDPVSIKDAIYILKILSERTDMQYLMEPPEIPPPGPEVNPNNPDTYRIIPFGAGSISNVINPASYECTIDHGTWIHSAGVVQPGIDSCSPIGQPTRIYPQVVGQAAKNPTPTHKWWGSISFHGEMKIGNHYTTAYITPDPLYARISNKGVRILGIPCGLKVVPDGLSNIKYEPPDPFVEVFDGIAVANSEYDDLQAYLKDYSDGSVTVQWQDGNKMVMEATFVHGSPYAYFKAFRGELVIKTMASIDISNQKGVFYEKNNHLGVWTNVAGIRSSFIISGEGDTLFENIESKEMTVKNTSNEITIALIPNTNGNVPDDETCTFFAQFARNVVRKVNIDYQVDRGNNSVTVSHTYLDKRDNPIETIAGLHPLHWKNSTAIFSPYKVRSARGVIKFSKTSQFFYNIPFVGVLPYLPTNNDHLDASYLKNLIREYASKNPTEWNQSEQGQQNKDTYWSGKAYGKIAEIIAIARSLGMENEAKLFTDFLKQELSDWFTAKTNGNLDSEKYFVYDSNWNTLLGVKESFNTRQQLNDHHFHYGYFVRAAAEICRTDPTWCSAEQYGPMIELLIRDYAGGKDDEMFPYVRNFDPANGFSWASGSCNFVAGNNNESTSEAANAYGAIILYGLITGNNEFVDRGIYLHASTSQSYWEYWNNIDRFRNNSSDYPDLGSDYDNFPEAYPKMTTSIIWGSGMSFSTWFSSAYAHILGIQGLPMNPLIFHVGQYADYMKEYVLLGLSQSSNQKPSGLSDDQWRDIWWELWAMTDADAAISDYETIAGNYIPENGETRAHTYHWLYTWKGLGHLQTGTGDITADYPAAVMFQKGSKKTYVVYNFDSTEKVVHFSDGQSIIASPSEFTVRTVENK